MLRRLLLFLSLIPACAFGSVSYTFSAFYYYANPSVGFGFTATLPDYISPSSGEWYRFTADQLSSCVTALDPGYVCRDAAISKMQDGILVGLTARSPDLAPTDFDSSYYITVRFPGDNILLQDGTTTTSSIGRDSLYETFTVSGQPDDITAVPEPAIAGTFVVGFGLLTAIGVIRNRRRG